MSYLYVKSETANPPPPTQPIGTKIRFEAVVGLHPVATVAERCRIEVRIYANSITIVGDSTILSPGQERLLRSTEFTLQAATRYDVFIISEDAQGNDIPVNASTYSYTVGAPPPPVTTKFNWLWVAIPAGILGFAMLGKRKQTRPRRQKNPGAAWHDKRTLRWQRELQSTQVPRLKIKYRALMEENEYASYASKNKSAPNPRKRNPVWQILTPSGYLIGRAQGTKKEAEAWAKAHYSAYRLKRDTSFTWK